MRNARKNIILGIAVMGVLLSCAGMSQAAESKDLASSSDYDIRYKNTQRVTGDAWLGYAQTACDINADGIKDIVFGARNADVQPGTDTVSWENGGAVYVKFGSASLASGDFDMQNSSNYDICYYTADDYLGYSVATGDVNDDGEDDLVIGAPYGDYGGSNSGNVYVIFGSTSIDTGDQRLDATGVWDIRYCGPTDSDYLGRQVVCGDVNGDGVDDIIMENSYQDYNGRGNSGSVFVVFGGTGISTGELDFATSTNYDIRFDGPTANNYLGYYRGIAAGGDVNNDTYGDLIMASRYYDYNGTDSGSVFVVFGGPSIPTGTVDLATSSNYDIRYDGTAAYDYLGYSVAMGDVNNDGVDDVIMGAPYDDNNSRSNSGSGYVVFGSSSIATGNISLSSSSNYDIRYDGASGDDRLGWEGSIGAGDVNGDNIDDVLLGCYTDDNNGSNSGSLYVIFGGSSITTGDLDLSSSSNYDIRFDGQDGDDHLSRGGIATGDVNNDTYDDILVGASVADQNSRTNSGSGYVILGGPSISTGTVSLASSSNYQLRMDGPAMGHHFGFDIESGDFNDDGIPDLLMSSYLDVTTSSLYGGGAYVIFGSDDMGSGDIDLTNASNYDIMYYGPGWDYLRNFAVGDVNADGVDDVIAAAPWDDVPSSSSGDVYVVFGSSSITTGNVYLNTANYDIKYGGAGGIYMARDDIVTGDINNDGADDIMMGAPYADYNSKTNSGSVYVVFGSVSPTTGYFDFTTESNFSLRFDGQGADDRLGESAGSLAMGDFNGDGCDDIVMGARYNDMSYGNAGAAFVVMGSENMDTSGVYDMGDSNKYSAVFTGGAGSHYIGYGGFTAGDINADGIDDMIISASYADYNSRGDSGSVYVIFGRHDFPTGEIALSDSSNYDVRIDGQSSSDYLGYYVTHAVGDVNGDGIKDLILQAFYDDYSGRTDSGCVYVIYGKKSWPSSIDLNDSTAYDELIGGPDGWARAACVGVRPVRKNSVCDLVIGAYLADTDGVPKAGAVYLIKNPAKFWDGGGADNRWATAANWSGDTVPGASDRVVFDVRSSKDCVIDAAASCMSVALMPGYTGKVTALAALTVTEGVVTHDGGFYYRDSTSVSTGENPVIDGGEYSQGAEPIGHWRFDEGSGALAKNDSYKEDTGESPVGWWKFDENTGTNCTDSSGNGLTATANAASWTTGKVGRGLNNTYATVSDNDLLEGMSAITISAWVYPTVLAGTDRQIVAKGDWNSDPAMSYRLMYQTDWGSGTGYPDGAWMFHLKTTGGDYWCRPDYSPSDPKDNQWHHIVGTYDGTTIKLYDNEVLIATMAATGTVLTNAYDVVIWGAAVGVVDDVRIYDYARTPDQFKYDYKSTHGTLVGDPTYSDGKFGKALSFDGTGDCVLVGDLDELDIGANQDFSVSLWLKFTGTGNEKPISKKQVDDNSNGWGFWTNSGMVYYKISNGTGSLQNSNGVAVNDGQWHHLVYAFDRDNNVTIYTDGEQTAQYSISSYSAVDFSNALSLAIGANNGGTTGYFTGSIDDVRIYKYVRSAAEILEDYNAGASVSIGGEGTAASRPTDPIGYWRFDEGGGTIAYDDSPNNLDGTFSAGLVEWTQDGKFGNALQFDGVANRNVTCSYKNVMDVSEFTMSGWVYRTTPGDTSTTHRVIRKVNCYQLGVSPTNGTVTVWGRDTADTWHSLTSDVADAIPLDEWHHISGSYDGDKFRIYIDGELKKESGSTVFTQKTDTSNLLIGGVGGANGVWEGKIDDVKLYDYARSAEEVEEDYNAGKVMMFGSQTNGDPWNGAAPVGYWKMDENTGTTVYDKSGNGNDGTITGATWTLGKKGACLQFNTTGYVDCGYDAVYDGDKITVEAWVYPDTTGPASDTERIVSRDRSDYWMLGQDTDNGIEWAVYAGGGIKYLFAPTGSLTTGQWNFVAATFDCVTGDQKVYVNGVEVDSTNVGAIGGTIGKGNNVPLGIGTNVESTPQGNNGFVGRIDDVKVYNYVRAPAQIAWDYNKGKPVAHWRFDEGEGATAYDDSVHDSDGTIDGATWVANGKFGKCLDFNGSSNWVSIPDAANVDCTDEITMSAWVNLDSYTAGGTNTDRAAVMIKASAYYMSITSSTGKLASFFYGVDPTHRDSNSQVPLNEWAHVAITYDGSNIRYYINGELDKTQAATGTITTNTSPVGVGMENDSYGRALDGKIDDVRIYNYARTADQIKEDYNQGFVVKFGE